MPRSLPSFRLSPNIACSALSAFKNVRRYNATYARAITFSKPYRKLKTRRLHHLRHPCSNAQHARCKAHYFCQPPASPAALVDQALCSFRRCRLSRAPTPSQSQVKLEKKISLLRPIAHSQSFSSGVGGVVYPRVANCWHLARR